MLHKIDQETAFVRAALNLRARRQEVLASNLANSDTPNYKARDLDFASALRAALGGKGGSLGLTRTQPGHLDGRGMPGEAMAALKYRAAVQPSLDGNTVDMDVERAHFTDNAMHYQFLLERTRSTFSTLKLALGPDR
ncbi:MAG TPA: flagellar basal body rod protein FlgB [Thiobacillaceae bacterium]|nr:flagellar basal body rod protein FlgB [Thiobacillaceae bacterium]HNU62971.1 flagellar basal body rod protein FlgB [Thiobacillaceae bacterium]